MMSLKKLTPLSVLLLAGFLTGCGHSEDEWQAQLSKYGKLNDKYQAEKTANQSCQAEVAAQQKRIAELVKQLERMGVNLDKKTSELQDSEAAKIQLGKNLAEMNAALEEYKKRAEALEKIKARFEALQKKLQKLVNLGLKVEIRHNRMVIRLPGDVLFPSGSENLKKEGKEVVLQVAEVIRKDEQLRKRYFQIAGHTDNKPLAGGRFGDNWGLSAMRARSVLVLLVSEDDAKGPGGGLDPNRLHAAGYGDTDPVSENNTDKGREQNRRVELVLMPDVEEMLDLQKM